MKKTKREFGHFLKPLVPYALGMAGRVQKEMKGKLIYVGGGEVIFNWHCV